MKAGSMWLGRCVGSTGLLLGLAGAGALAAEGQVVSRGGNTSYTQSGEEGAVGRIDFKNAKPRPLPIARKRPIFAPAAPRPLRVPGFRRGARGEGATLPEVLTGRAEASLPDLQARTSLFPSAAGPVPQEYGTASNHPYTTSRVDLAGAVVSKAYPHSAVGKIYFTDGVDTFVCTGSLIARGLIVTAAHCVTDFGSGLFYSGWQFVPALSGKKKPYGTWSVLSAWVKSSYLDGTEPCADPPVVCPNDIAILVVKPKGKTYPGKKTGYLGFGWDGFGFAPTNPEVVLVNQLGYPVSHDDGLMMQRTDSQGFVDATQSDNTVWGSRQTGGSSGGPELVNLGQAAVLDGVALGDGSGYNVVIGVTSWGYTDGVTKEQGASPFNSDNIVSLVDSACADSPLACIP